MNSSISFWAETPANDASLSPKRSLKEFSLKKRLRKKLRRGEFRSVGFEVRFELDQSMADEHIDQFVDEFIVMIEATGLQFGGGGKFDWCGIVERKGGCGAVTEQERQAVLGWINRQQKVLAASGGLLTFVDVGLPKW